MVSTKKIIPLKDIEYSQHCLSVNNGLILIKALREKPKNYCKTHIYKLDYNTKYVA